MQNRKELTAAFRRLFRKNANQQEKELLARWFSRLDLSEGEIFRNKVEEQELEKKIERNLYDHFFPEPASNNIFRIPSWLPATAAAVLIVIAGSLWLMPARELSNEVVFEEAVTTTGERKIVTLADGSKITLSNSSRIKFPTVFADSLREIFLEGEAFFEIAHDISKPFRVKTGKLNIQVLGTSFNVRHYNTDKNIDIVVATGKVGVYTKSSKTTWMLTPGHLLSFNQLTGKTEEHIVNPNDYTSWQKGELIFKDETIENICMRLERWYGVSITIKNPALKRKRINLKQKNENLHTVLKMLALVGSFEFEIKDKTVKVW